jgi:endonuclease-3
MNFQEKIDFIQNKLEALFPNPPIPLKHKDPYTLLIAVVLSARSRDDRVNQITPQLFELADAPAQMVALSIDTIQKIIKPCGLSPFKAKSIHTLSQILLDCYQGKVPANFEALESLPGVGHKTASVVMSQAFQVPAFPVDTHIYRLAHRWELTTHKSLARTEQDLKAAFPENKWIRLHLQMIAYARAYCTAWACKGYTCEICRTLHSELISR